LGSNLHCFVLRAADEEIVAGPTHACHAAAVAAERAQQRAGVGVPHLQPNKVRGCARGGYLHRSCVEKQARTFNVVSLLDDTSCALSAPMWMGCQLMLVMKAVWLFSALPFSSPVAASHSRT
jgi:hypothetical protein